MKKHNYTKSKITLLLSLMFLLSTVVVSYSQAYNQEGKATIPDCYICDYNGCEYSHTTQAGGTNCSSPMGWCFLEGDCCGDCEMEEEPE